MRLGIITLALTATLALAGCSGDDDPQDTPDAAPPSSDSGSTPEPELITYAGGESPGVEVQSSAETDRLEGAPGDFAEFIGVVADELAEQSTCQDGYVGVTVAVVRTDGFARGGVNDCGGYAALWAVVDGEWLEIDGSQEPWDCSILEKYEVPDEVAGTKCFDGDKLRTYEHA